MGACDSSTEPETVYTMEDLQGTWEMVSNSVELEYLIDVSYAYSTAGQDACTSLSGSWSEQNGCVFDSSVAAFLYNQACSQLQGSLSGSICTVSINEETCCCPNNETGNDQQVSCSISQTLTVSSDGALSLVTVNYGEETTQSGVLTINGSSIIWNMEEQNPLNGTVSILGNSLTIRVGSNDLSDILDPSGADDSFSQSITSGSATIIMSMNKVN